MDCFVYFPTSTSIALDSIGTDFPGPLTLSPSVHAFPALEKGFSKPTGLPLSLKVLEHCLLLPRRPGPRPELGVVRLGELLRLEPLAGLGPDLDEAEDAWARGVLEDVEEEALGLCGACCPHWPVGGLELVDPVRLDVEGHEERALLPG